MEINQDNQKPVDASKPAVVTETSGGLAPAPASPGWNSARRSLIAFNVILMVLIGLAIFAGLNYLSTRYYYRLDCTFRQTYKLSEKSKNVLTQLTKPVQIYALFVYNHAVVPRLKDLLEEYKMNSRNIIVEEIEIYKEPALTEAKLKYLTEELKVESVLQENDIVFVYEGKSKVVNMRDTYTPKYDYSNPYMQPQETGIDVFRGEEAFSSAILSVIQAKKIKVYFTEGHNEPELSKDLLYLDKTLKGENMDTQAINLHTSKNTPKDADILIIAGPSEPFLPDETNQIREYLKKGGKVLILISAGMNIKLEGLLKEWGIILEDVVVIDQQCNSVMGLMKDYTAPQVTDYGIAFHPITKDLKAKGLPTPLVFCRSMEKDKETSQDIQTTEIAHSSKDSWGETDIAGVLDTGKARLDENEKKGPLTLAFAISKPVSGTTASSTEQLPETRLVVIGASEMIKNRYLHPESPYYLGPNDFVINSIRWLARQEQFITIEPKKPEDTSIDLSKDNRPLKLTLISLVFIPSIGLLLGIIVWIMRRK
ncbi:MAG: GldG family protein [Planctomycetes bacterium]|nr:GldG family protein [Planctomycetota bacterium]